MHFQSGFSYISVKYTCEWNFHRTCTASSKWIFRWPDTYAFLMLNLLKYHKQFNYLIPRAHWEYQERAARLWVVGSFHVLSPASSRSSFLCWSALCAGGMDTVQRVPAATWLQCCRSKCPGFLLGKSRVCACKYVLTVCRTFWRLMCWVFKYRIILVSFIWGVF